MNSLENLWNWKLKVLARKFKIQEIKNPLISSEVDF